MKYLPKAVYKLLENIPSPWESNKMVNVVYHKQGIISIVNSINKTDEL